MSAYLVRACRNRAIKVVQQGVRIKQLGEYLQVYLITELLTGGELLDAVLERGSYNEADARFCFIQLLRGIEYLHSKYVPLSGLPVPL